MILGNMGPRNYKRGEYDRFTPSFTFAHDAENLHISSLPIIITALTIPPNTA
jgi:hypothetical protein